MMDLSRDIQIRDRKHLQDPCPLEDQDLPAKTELGKIAQVLELYPQEQL